MTNYDGFMKPVSWFLAGMEKRPDSRDTGFHGNGVHFWDRVSLAMAKLPGPSFHTVTNRLSNHDHSRFLTRTNGRIGRPTEPGSTAAGEGM